MGNGITDVAGVLVGHSTNLDAATGCTVVLCPQGAVAGVDVRGSAPGTRETDLLRPGNLVQQVHAILLSGGSAYGLDAASGVMRYLEERDAGYRIGPGVVPIVPAAIISTWALSPIAFVPARTMATPPASAPRTGLPKRAAWAQAQAPPSARRWAVSTQPREAWERRASPWTDL